MTDDERPSSGLMNRRAIVVASEAYLAMFVVR